MLEIQIAETKAEKDKANELVVAYHSYVANPKTVGRVIKYLILFNNELVGSFWLGSGFKPTPKPILNYFNKSQSEFDLMFNEVADNKRFVMAKTIPNLGSQILKNIRYRAKKDWLDRYNNDLKAIITTIGAGKSGAVYKADNWVTVGFTAGLPAQRKSVSMKWNDTEEIKTRFVKPTGENRKIILLTERL